MIKLIDISSEQIALDNIQEGYLNSEAGVLNIKWCSRGVLACHFVDGSYANSKSLVDYLCQQSDQIPLLVFATEFQMSVWDSIAKLPLGKVDTYKELALRVGRPDAVRAVGSALGKNNHALFIPCHRAIRSDGGLGGFRWGLKRKSHLLQLEADGLDVLKEALMRS